MIWIPITFTCWIMLGTGMNFANAGKPRKPISSGEAVGGLVANIMLIALIWYLYSS
ncbi:hypothetical protein U6G28_08860 [Actinomycetaceae bacterium MB13-C1-2]|nr:hypothetical protein U6G28_08860 [Actinomycetaceae bacterium MB13-C1-2]